MTHTLRILGDALAAHDRDSTAWHSFHPALEDDGLALAFTTPAGHRVRLGGSLVADLAFEAWTEFDGSSDNTWGGSGIRLGIHEGRVEIACKLDVPLQKPVWYTVAQAVVSHVPAGVQLRA